MNFLRSLGLFRNCQQKQYQHTIFGKLEKLYDYSINFHIVTGEVIGGGLPLLVLGVGLFNYLKSDVFDTVHFLLSAPLFIIPFLILINVSVMVGHFGGFIVGICSPVVYPLIAIGLIVKEYNRCNNNHVKMPEGPEAL